MKSTYAPGMCLLIMLFCISSAGVPGRKGIEIQDGAGRKVIVPAEPHSVVSLSPSNTEILFAIGAGEMVSGVTDFCNYPEETSGIPKVGGFADVNIEKIAELGPDIILGSHLHISTLVPALENLGFPVIIINPGSVSAVFDSIELVGKVCNREYGAGKLVTDLKSLYTGLSEKLRKKEPVTVYWELSDDYWTIGRGSYLDDLITRAGGQNIAGDLDAPWLQLSSEFILNANPHTIFLADHPYGVTLHEITDRPGWGSLEAVRTHRVIEVPVPDNDIVSRAGPRVIQALEFIAKHLHPDLF